MKRTSAAGRGRDALKQNLEAARLYRVWGKANLDDAAWSEVEAGGEADYRFFRVTVEMP